MPGSAARRGLWALGAAIVVVVLVVAALPLVASTQIVRDRIAGQMGAWSGYRVQLGEAPRIQVWPSFQAILNDVAFARWGDSDAAPVAEAERIEVNLSALAALRGKVVFTNMRVVRPVIRVASRDPFPTVAPPGGGKLIYAINTVRRLVKANPTDPDTSALPDDPFGTVHMSDGRVVLADGAAAREIVTSLSATLSWPALDRPATLQAKGIWHGENVTLDARTTAPLVLLAGGNAPLAVSLKAAPVDASFDGTANLSQDPFVDGKLALSSPSMKRLIEWVRGGTMPGGTIGSIALSSKVSGGKRLKFENAELTFDGNSGMGVLDMTFDQSPPGITGTLAFKTIDLQSFLSAFTPLPAAPSDAGKVSQTSFTNGFNLDLRLSATSAAVDTVALAGVAATAQVKDGLAAFDISDATAFGGTVQFGMRVDREIGGDLFELRATAKNIEGRQVAAKLGMDRLIPHARGSLSLILKGSGPGWESVLENARGSISASFGKGTVPGLDLDAFLSRNASGGFFALSQVQDGSLPVDSIELKATLSDGIARIDKAEAVSGKRTISLGGLIPLVGRGIALSGTVTPAADGEKADGTPAAFFVGGSWSAPFISPAVPGLPPG